MSPETAETIALQALSWLVGNEEILPVFLGSSGSSIDDIKARADDPQFLASVLEFLTMDDTWVIAFCDSVNLPYENPLKARYALPGAEQVHWT